MPKAQQRVIDVTGDDARLLRELFGVNLAWVRHNEDTSTSGASRRLADPNIFFRSFLRQFFERINEE